MSLVKNALKRFAVAAGVATATLASAFAPGRLSEAGLFLGQEPAQKAVTVEVKQEDEIRKEAFPATPPIRIIEKQGQGQGGVAGKVVIQRLRNGGNGDNFEQATRTIVRQLAPILRGELRVLTSSADPSPTQRREIAMEGGRVLKQVAGNLARAGNQARRVGTATSDPRKLIHEAVEAEAKAKLSPDQFARFQKESEGKARDRREVVVLNIVAKMDQVLLLSRDQREKLCETFRSEWYERTYPSVEMLQSYSLYFPMIPDTQTRPILSEDQWKIWQDVLKLNFGQVRDIALLGQDMVDNPDDEPDDADLKAALAEDPKP